MPDLTDIITQLEQQRDAIERALSALRDVGVTGAPSAARRGRPAKTASAPGTTSRAKKRVLSPEGRRRIIEAIKRRWAAKRAADAASQRTAGKKAASKKAAKKKGVTKKKQSPGSTVTA